jgi:hypothetical protein
MRALRSIARLRPLKRLLVFLSEAGVLVIGLIGSLALGFLAALLSGRHGDDAAAAAFYGGLLLTVAAFFVRRRKTRPWKINYDVASYRIEKAERKLHPARAKVKRTLFRAAMWLPSAVATLVVFFFPIASHLACPNSVRGYRVPIRWTDTIFFVPGLVDVDVVDVLVSNSSSRRLAFTPFWNREPALLSQMSFSSRTNTDTVSYDAVEATRESAAEVIRRDLNIGGLTLSCWQYLPREHIYRSDVGVMWRINCQTPADVPKRNFYASFFGHESDIPIFYKVIEGVTPLD